MIFQTRQLPVVLYQTIISIYNLFLCRINRRLWQRAVSFLIILYQYKFLSLRS